VPCLALRVTYVGELGWELSCTMEFGLRLWDEVWAAGRGTACSPAATRPSTRSGSRRATGSGAPTLRRPEPYEAGLGLAVKLDKGDFIGREALVDPGEPEIRLACLTLGDPRAVALGSEPVRAGGELVGRVMSGAAEPLYDSRGERLRA
jgi:glycine cleavage system aminomethyltransferase T